MRSRGVARGGFLTAVAMQHTNSRSSPKVRLDGRIDSTDLSENDRDLEIPSIATLGYY
jgi:hypothetical protein